MGKPEAFLNQLETFKEKIDTDLVKGTNFSANKDTIADENFSPEIIKTKSSAAGNLCNWVINITKYYEVVVTVEPKKAAVKKAQETLAEANEKKMKVDALVAELSAALEKLEAEFKAAMDEKEAAESEAARCMKRLDNAQRLVNALGSESDRWNQAIVDLTNDLTLVVGDVLLASSFVSYVGPFNKRFRDIIMEENFIDFFRKNNIPHSPSANPLVILTDDAQVAEWNNQKLPSDKVSTENGAILTNSERWPLIIDP
jgi:dynein heavy chain